MIQVAAQLITHVGDDARVGPAAGCSKGARRTPISAARSPRVICGACRWRGTPPAAAPGRRVREWRRASRSQRRRSARCASASAYAFVAPSKSPRASRSSPICVSELASLGSRVDGLAEMLERRLGVAVCRSTAASSRYRNGAVGRARDRRRVDAGCASSSLPARGRLPRRSQLARRHGTAAPRHAARVGQRRVGRQRRLERGERVASRFEREKRLSPADQRGRIGRAAARARESKCAQRAPCRPCARARRSQARSPPDRTRAPP